MGAKSLPRTLAAPKFDRLLGWGNGRLAKDRTKRSASVRKKLFLGTCVLVAASVGAGEGQQASTQRPLNEIDGSDYQEWKLHNADCTRMSQIRIHTDPDGWAPNMTFSCYKATGNQMLGIKPGQWVMIQLSNGTWSLLTDADRRS